MNDLDRLSDLVAAARRAGADAADALLVQNASLSVSRRLGKVEQLERSEGFDLGLRVFLGQRQAIVSSTDADPRGFAALAERAVAMAKVVPEDPFGGLPDGFDPPRDAGPLDLLDATEPTAEELIARAGAAEDSALAVRGITNSEGADAGWGRVRVALVMSNGFAGGFGRSSHSLSCTALAGQGTGMERDYEWSSTVHLADLGDPAEIGRRAAEKALRRLNPVRARTARIPVVYDPRVSSSLIGHLAGAANGASVARGTSFLREHLGKQVLPKGMTIRDDPTRPRGLRSRPFDGEGMAGAPRAIVEDGVLTTWILDWRSARQLGTRSTGHASRGTGGPPGPSTTNLWLEPGTMTPKELMADIAEGLYVHEMIGMGINGVTGDYSRGATGFMIRGGQLAEPVAEITVAGNLKDMFLNMTAADDLEFRRGTDAPTIRVEGMTLAGA